jgi:tRNA(Ile)-lysidine synthetase-like protein
MTTLQNSKLNNHEHDDYSKIIEQPNINDINWIVLNLDNDVYKTSLLKHVINYDISVKNINKIHQHDEHQHDEYQHDIISLSGGVDSMVLATLLIAKHKNKQLIAIHINYKNRTETDLEEKFLNEWCKYNNIIFISYNMGELRRHNIPREHYEKETKRLRFELYNSVLEKYPACGIYLAHHLGDEQENTFSNVINGKNLLSLSAMQDRCVINNVNILRPLINFPKSEIFNFAHKYKIPYFKDTTPDWSNRGKLRRQIFPLLDSVYGNKYLASFTNLSKESSEWKDFLMSLIINPFIEEYVSKNHKTTTIIILDQYRKYPQCFWELILTCQNIRISKKALVTLSYKIKTYFVGYIPLSKSTNGIIDKNKLTIIHS